MDTRDYGLCGSLSSNRSRSQELVAITRNESALQPLDSRQARLESYSKSFLRMSASRSKFLLPPCSVTVRKSSSESTSRQNVVDEVAAVPAVRDVVADDSLSEDADDEVAAMDDELVEEGPVAIVMIVASSPSTIETSRGAVTRRSPLGSRSQSLRNHRSSSIGTTRGQAPSQLQVLEGHDLEFCSFRAYDHGPDNEFAVSIKVVHGSSMGSASCSFMIG
jgi:hypothetical protein